MDLVQPPPDLRRDVPPERGADDGCAQIVEARLFVAHH